MNIILYDIIHTCASCTFMAGQHPHLCLTQFYSGRLYTPVLNPDVRGEKASTPVHHTHLRWYSIHTCASRTFMVVQHPHLCFMHNYGGIASTPVLRAYLLWDSIHTCASNIFMVGQHPHLCFIHIYGGTASTPVLHAHLWWDSIHTCASHIVGSNTRHTYMIFAAY